MKVYLVVVEFTLPYCGIHVNSVWSTKEGAEKEASRFSHWEVVEFTLDEPKVLERI